MNQLEKWFLQGMIVWRPKGNTETLEEILNVPLDVIYLTRKQTEREEKLGEEE